MTTQSEESKNKTWPKRPKNKDLTERSCVLYFSGSLRVWDAEKKQSWYWCDEDKHWYLSSWESAHGGWGKRIKFVGWL